MEALRVGEADLGADAGGLRAALGHVGVAVDGVAEPRGHLRLRLQPVLEADHPRRQVLGQDLHEHRDARHDQGRRVSQPAGLAEERVAQIEETRPEGRAVGDGVEPCRVLEPLQGEAGVLVPQPGYLAAARRITREHGALLWLDEVQTGVGRTGSFWAHDPAVEPDVLTVEKLQPGQGVRIDAIPPGSRRQRRAARRSR